jgi:GT2 family glycosyltransferase
MPGLRDMPIQRFKNVLRGRIARAAEFGGGPFGPVGAGVARRSGDVWRGTGGDPQFLFPAPFKQISTLVLYVTAERDGALTPRIYFNWGGGLSQDDSVGFEPVRAALISLTFEDCPDLRRLRFDPLESTAEFTFRWAADREGEALAREVEPELAALEARRAPILRKRIAAADFAPALRERPFGVSRKPRSVHEHFLHACALARRDVKAEPAPPAPLISFVSPLYNTTVAYLDDLLGSFRHQAQGFAELVLSDDGSTSAETAKWLAAHENEPGLVVLRNGVNRGIAAASNSGVAASRGAWIGFIDHDDALAPYAVAVIARAIAENPAARFFYTDELIADGRMHGVDIFDKPAFDDVLLSGVNYINHLSLYPRDLFEAVGGFREGFDGSQDYDLLLRALARLKRDDVRHIPYPAYVWRRDGGSYSVKFIEKATANARRALAEAYGSADVEPANLPDLHRVRLDRRAAKPKVSIVTPSRDAFRLMSIMTEGLFEGTDYPDFELIVVDNGSTDPDTLALYERLKRERANFTLDMAPAPFNFSRQVNRGVALAKGDAILLLNNDVEVVESDWLAEMVGCLAYPQAGIVGARLLYPGGDLQHAGVVVGLSGLAGHWYNHRPADFPGPMGRLAVRSAMSAVTGACMLISRACLDAVEPFDGENFAVAYNDVDFCLRARSAGFRTIYTPFATLIHHESATRGLDERGPNRARFLRDQAALIERRGTEDFLDPVLSPWRAREGSEPARVALDALPPVR